MAPVEPQKPDERELQAREPGPQRRRQWRKLHLAMDAAASDICTVEFAPSRDGDSPVPHDLLGQISEEDEAATVTADGTYGSHRSHNRHRRTGRRADHPGLQERKGVEGGRSHRRRTQRDAARHGHHGRAFWKRWTGYTARSRIEARMHRLKVFGERIAARDPDRQTAEVATRVALMNRFNAIKHRPDRPRCIEPPGGGSVMPYNGDLQQCPTVSCSRACPPMPSVGRASCQSRIASFALYRKPTSAAPSRPRATPPCSASSRSCLSWSCSSIRRASRMSAAGVETRARTDGLRDGAASWILADPFAVGRADQCVVVSCRPDQSFLWDVRRRGRDRFGNKLRSGAVWPAACRV